MLRAAIVSGLLVAPAGMAVAGPCDEATGAAALTIDNVDGGTGSCSTTGNDLDCSLGTLASGGTWTVTVDVTSFAPGTYTFVAMNDDPSGGEGNAPDSDSKTFVIE